MFKFTLPGSPATDLHYVKLRPGINTFFRDAMRQYELSIYTHGTRSYAEEIAKIMDPTGGIFRGRIVSRSGHGRMCVACVCQLRFCSS